MTKFEERKAARRQERIAQANANAEAMAENDTYIDYVLDLEDEEAVVSKLQTVIDKLNSLETIIATDGTKYSINCFALPEHIFNAALARLLAIIKITPAMFTDERKTAYTAITGISHLAMSNAEKALGSPAYYNKGIKTDATDYDISKLNLAIAHICITMKIPVMSVTQAQLDKWYTNEELKALTKLEAFTKSTLLNESSHFTIED